MNFIKFPKQSYDRLRR